MLTSPLHLVRVASGIGIEWQAAYAEVLMGAVDTIGILAGEWCRLRGGWLRI